VVLREQRAAVALLIDQDHLALRREGRQHLAEADLDRTERALQHHQRRTARAVHLVVQVEVARPRSAGLGGRGVRGRDRGASLTAPAPGGIPRIPRATVEIQPLKPLPDGWYVLKVFSVPSGLALPRFGSRQTLPDGSLGARISPGSHPRPAAVKVCPKEGGVTVVSIEWSEAVVRPRDVSSAATVREVSAPSMAGDCVPDSGQPDGSVRAMRFLCQNVPTVGGRFLVRLDRGVRGIGGGNLDIRVNAATGKADTEVAVDSMQPGADGCKTFRPW